MATPIAVAVREGRFTPVHYNLLLIAAALVQRRDVYTLCLQCLQLQGCACLGLPICHVDHFVLLLVVVLCPCLWAPGWGEPGFRGGPCLAVVWFCCSLSDPG